MISIIIPVYNAAPYLRACLDSVIAQNYSCWQCVCVDDGSTDCSGKILDEYANRDGRFKVFHQENKGVSVARNTALSICTGDYFMFLDADDILLPEALLSCAKELCIGAFDALCCCPLSIAFQNENELTSFESTEYKAFVIDDKMELLWGKCGEYGFPFGRVYSRRLFGGLRFPIGLRMSEDAWYWLDALTIQARWGLLRRPMCGYRQVPTSASNTIDAEFCRCVFLVLCHTIDVLNKLAVVDCDPFKKFWNKHCAGLCHMLRLVFKNWKYFSEVDRKNVNGFIVQSIEMVGYNPYPMSYRIRIAFLSSRLSSCVLMTVGFIADWFWPRLKRRGLRVLLWNSK